ncbi:MAG TPA: hypothetical protein ENN03_04000 [bacterium]|nr:hypothetical protein [bacterium]
MNPHLKRQEVGLRTVNPGKAGFQINKEESMDASVQKMAEVLKAAIEVEKNGMKTFSQFAEQTQDESGKRVFLRLAGDEKEHQDILEKQLRGLNETGRWEQVEIPVSQVEKLLPKIRERAREVQGESGIGEKEALKTALDLERKTADFFREKAREVEHPQARDFFHRLAEWEDAHYELIQAELDSINNTGMWFGVPEFRMDGQF